MRKDIMYDQQHCMSIIEDGGVIGGDSNNNISKLANDSSHISSIELSCNNGLTQQNIDVFECSPLPSSITNQKPRLNNSRKIFSWNKNNKFRFDVPPEAPIFTPTENEFKNPLLYISKIRPIAEKYGICKIRPPATWQPPFTLDIEKLRFTPRIQQLNELEARTRVKLNFLDQIAKFWELQGSSLKMPTIEGKPLDLYLLHRIVQNEGGLEETIKNRKWSKIAAHMGYQQGKSVNATLKSHYERILYPFDVYTSGKMNKKNKIVENDHDCTSHFIQSQQLVSEHELSLRSKSHVAHRTASDPLAKYVCHICNRSDVEESMLLCDSCDGSYHTFCLIPPLTVIPKRDWRCPNCVVEEVNKPIDAFGFDQAEREYTLQQFREMADQFKSDYFNMPVNLVPTEVVEKEFWRIVSSIDEDVTVEYGADLHAMDHGSGFPTKSALHLLPSDQEYAESSWNLNNLPLLEESILGHIDGDISGMTVPWMYVGMCFATFCWHNEDHWSYSINYLHWGEPKSWYSVPGNNAELFEETMRSAAPELFVSQPDLLHQLVTIINPNILMNAGVPVYRTDQLAGEFVVTFPRAYHAGFNQGYNFAEAVNFAPAEWLKMGRECINNYSTLRRFCVFSHDELVCKMAQNSDRLNFGIAVSCYLDMTKMLDSETKLRNILRMWGISRNKFVSFGLIPDDKRQCEICKTTCFLSAVGCSCSKNIVCLRHFTQLCQCPPDRHTLQYNYTLNELNLMLRKLIVKTECFENWVKKLKGVKNATIEAKITLEELRELQQEANERNYPNSKLLRGLNSTIIEADKCVNVILHLDINKVRTGPQNTKYKLTIDELDRFVHEIDNLWCVIKESNNVRELQKIAKDFIAKATNLLSKPFNTLTKEELEKAIDEGSSLSIKFPEIDTLKDRITQVAWFYEVRKTRDLCNKVPLSELQRLLSEGKKVTPHQIIERELAELDNIITSVHLWEAATQKCFKICTENNIPQIEDHLNKADLIKSTLPSYNQLKVTLKHLKEWVHAIEILQSNESCPYLHTIEKIVELGKNIPFQLVELRKMEKYLEWGREWKDRLSRTFLHKQSQFAIMEVLSPRSEPFMFSNHEIEDETSCEKFTEEISPSQTMDAFKEAEDREIRGIIELRKMNSEKNPKTDLYCICNRNYFGTMYHCQLCHNWFHAQCVPPLENIPNPIHGKDAQFKYLCQSCLRSRRPNLEIILSLLVSLERLPIRMPEGEALQYLTERVMNWQDRARRLLTSSDISTAIEQLRSLTIRMRDPGTAIETNSYDVYPDPPQLQTKSSSILATIEKRALSSMNNEHSYALLTHAFKSDRSQPDGDCKQIDKSKPLITIPNNVRANLENLMMEGDLLEVALDDTLFIWHLLNATKPGYTDPLHILHKYNVKPVTTIETNMFTNKKREANECLNQQIKLAKLQSVVSTQTTIPVLTKSSLPIIISSDEDGVVKNKLQFKKYVKLNSTKRGRKLKLGQAFAALAQKIIIKKKLKKKIWNMTSISRNAVSTSSAAQGVLVNVCTSSRNYPQRTMKSKRSMVARLPVFSRIE